MGSAGGTQTPSHLVRLLRDTRKGWIVIKLDAKNAYGTIARELIHRQLLQIAAKKDISYARQYFARFITNTHHIVTRGKATAKMADGLWQVEVLAPLLFSVAKDAIVSHINTIPDNKWYLIQYMDNDIIVADPSAALEAYKFIRDSTDHTGLQINPSKTEILVFDKTRQPEIAEMASSVGIPTKATARAINILGTPVGDPETEVSLAVENFHKSKTSYDRLRGLRSVSTNKGVFGKQSKLMILRDCLNTVVNHTARTLAPDSAKAVMKLHEKEIRRNLEEILAISHDRGAPILNKIGREIALPLSHGGLGIGNLSETKHIAFVAGFVDAMKSIHDSYPDLRETISFEVFGQEGKTRTELDFRTALKTVTTETYETDDSLTALSEVMSNTKWSQFIVPRLENTPFIRVDAASKLDVTTFYSTYIKGGHQLGKLQKQLSWDYANRTFLEIFDGLKPHKKAQYLSKMGNKASEYLNAFPSGRKFEITDDEMVIDLRIRFRLPFLTYLGIRETDACPCSYNKILTADIQRCTEDHVLKCKVLGAYIVRHDMLNDGTIEMLTSSVLSVRKEGRMVFGSNHRGDAIFMELGVTHIHGTTVVAPTKAATIPYAARTPGYAIREAEKHKRDKYNGFLSEKDTALTVLGYEVFGAMSEQVTHLVHRLAKKMINQAPEDGVCNSSAFTSYWIKAISVTLHRGTAIAVKMIASKINFQERPAEQANRYVLEAQPGHTDDSDAAQRATQSVPRVPESGNTDSEDSVDW